jgi:RinA family phage transcriptional activator
MKQSLRKHIEDELRDYDTTKADWESIQDDIINGGGHGDDSGIRGTDISNPTASKALQMITNKRLAQLQKTIKAIEGIMMRLPEEKYRLIVLKYWTKPQPLNDVGISMELNCSLSTYYEWKNAILKLIAIELGLI